MTISFPELETDEAAIAAFNARHNSATETTLQDAGYEADLALATEILSDDSYLKGVVRRGAWLYTFLRNEDHPKGLWRRLPEGAPLKVESPWQPVFDLDAFCAETGEDWHWRGAETAFFDPEKLLLCLSWKGSDQKRFIEWDASKQAPVEGGFDLGPERNIASWLDADTLLYSTATGDWAATRSGWPGRVVKLSRGMAIEDAPVVYEVDPECLLGYGYAFAAPGGQTAVSLAEVRVIGESNVTLFPDGLSGPNIALDTPRNTNPRYNTTHYAYVAADDGPHAPGTLVLKTLDGETTRTLFEPRPYASVDEGSIVIGERWMLWIETDRMAPTLRILDLSASEAPITSITPPKPAESLSIGPFDASPNGDGPLLLSGSGFLLPPTTWKLDIGKSDTDIAFTELVAQSASFDASGLEVHLHSAISNDGTEVPYHIVLPKERTAPLPVLQYGYGGFSVALGPSYQRLSGPLWLTRGGAYVLAYIRGGSEFGASWHLAAKRENRARAFEDFAAVASDLVDRGYSTPEKIACSGGSNGGLLCSVMLTRYPERFGAIWASVAVTDMLRYHLFPAGAGWMDEYGDPDAEPDRTWLKAYSPVHNVAPSNETTYPPALIVTNDSDDRVDPSHSRRFAALLEEAGQPLTFLSRAGGHAGGGNLHEMAQNQALGFAFLRKTIARPSA